MAVGAGASEVRVAIVDDHESVRLGLEIAFRASGYAVVASVQSTQALQERIPAGDCDVVILDSFLADGESIRRNVEVALHTGAAVIVYECTGRNENVREALTAGAAGVVPKSAPIVTVLQATSIVAAGDRLPEPDWDEQRQPEPNLPKVPLGRRERDVLHMYASGLPLKVVAAELGISYSTAREYLSRIRTKYESAGRPAPTKIDLLRRAVEDGILPDLLAEA